MGAVLIVARPLAKKVAEVVVAAAVNTVIDAAVNELNRRRLAGVA